MTMPSLFLSRLFINTLVLSVVISLAACGTSSSSKNSPPAPQPPPSGGGTGGSGGGTGGSGGSGGGGGTGSGGSGGSGSAAPQFLYTANEGSSNQMSGSISAFTIDGNTGILAPVAGAPFAADFNPAALASDPNGKFLYVGEIATVPGVRGANCLDNRSKLLIMSIAPTTGALNKTNEIDLAGSCVTSMVIDPSGSTLYVGDVTYLAGDYQIEAYALDGSGNAAPIAGSPYATTQSGDMLAVRPDGKTVYVGGAATTSPTSISVFSRSDSGALTLQQQVPLQWMYDLRTTKAGDFLIATLRDSQGATPSNDSVNVYSIDSSGNLSQASTVTTAMRNAGSDTAPSGKFVALSQFGPTLTTDGFAGTLAIYNFSGGNMTKGSTASTANTPSAPRFDVSGKFVYTASFNDAVMNGFRVDADTGALTPVATATPKTGDHPSDLVLVSPK